ncbi:MAG: hypothetical protein ACXVBV_14835, partial [Isosphaeraceae bacterium]
MSPNVSTWQPNQRTIRLRDGRGVHVRPIRAEDEPLPQGRIAVEQAEPGTRPTTLPSRARTPDPLPLPGTCPTGSTSGSWLSWL